jgi:hypothetical protein
MNASSKECLQLAAARTTPDQPPILNPKGTKPTVATFVGLFSITVAAGGLLFFFDPLKYGFYPRCLLHEATGLLCPGCGSLRAAHQLLHGNLLAAVHLNALFVLSLAVALVITARFLLGGRKGQRQWPDFQRRWLWLALVVGILFGVLRNLPFAHSLWLAP